MKSLPPELMGLIRRRDWDAVHEAVCKGLEETDPDMAVILAAKVIQAMDILGGGLHADAEACRTAGWILMQAGADDHAAQYLQVAENIARAQAEHKRRMRAETLRREQARPGPGPGDEAPDAADDGPHEDDETERGDGD